MSNQSAEAIQSVRPRRHKLSTPLALWRQERNLSQQEAADLIGITQPHYSLIERDKRRLSGPVRLTIARLMAGEIAI